MKNKRLMGIIGLIAAAVIGTAIYSATAGKDNKVASSNEKAKVGVLQLVSHPSLDLIYKGIQDAHGLRSIARTFLEDQQVDFRIAESCLAHSIGNKTSQAYNRYDYVELRRPVMQLWSDFVERCEKESV